jgi:hypothetical protein
LYALGAGWGKRLAGVGGVFFGRFGEGVLLATGIKNTIKDETFFRFCRK